MPPNNATTSNLESTANTLVETLGAAKIDQIARECGFLRRKRDITPMGMLVSCISTLGVAHPRWLADIHRAFNKQTDKNVAYKPFHNQLAKESFPDFLHAILCEVLTSFSNPVLESLPRQKLTMFKDIRLHDGSSFALKKTLADDWPGRFTAKSPAAVELHVTMSLLDDQPIAVTLAADKESEHAYRPSASDVAGCLLLEDRGYESRRFFLDVQKAGGHYIVRGKHSIRPTIVKAYGRDGRRIKKLEGKTLTWQRLPSEDVDLEITWDQGKDLYTGRIVAIYKRGKRNQKTFTYLHTNLKRERFTAEEVGTLYRLRWQIELLFKEWKSYAGLHRFDTSKSTIAEGLIWASIIAATLKRFIGHAAERQHGIEISTQRVAASARHFLDDILQSLGHGRRVVKRCLLDALDYLARNAARAHPRRDREKGRLKCGLRPIAVGS